MSIKFKVWLARIGFHGNKLPLRSVKVPNQSVLYSDKTNYLNIIDQYASLIGRMLWSAFANLTRADLSKSSGFSQTDKASSALQHYFKIYNILQLFIKNNIGEEKNDETRAIAFIKWMDVAAMLDQNQCYDGFWLVLIALILVNNEQLRAQLPPVYNKKLDEYITLSSPVNNYGHLRNKLEGEEGSFYPAFLWFKDLTFLDAWNEDDNSDHEGSLHQKENLLDTIELLIRENKPQSNLVAALSMAEIPVAGDKDAWNLLDLIRLDLINHFMQNESRTTGWFGGELRTINGVTYKIPLGIAQIYDQLDSVTRHESTAHELLSEIRQVVASRQEANHTFFNSRQTITQKFYQQCSESIDHFFDNSRELNPKN